MNDATNPLPATLAAALRYALAIALPVAVKSG